MKKLFIIFTILFITSCSKGPLEKEDTYKYQIRIESGNYFKSNVLTEEVEGCTRCITFTDADGDGLPVKFCGEYRIKYLTK